LIFEGTGVALLIVEGLVTVRQQLMNIGLQAVPVAGAELPGIHV
jgi:hypothetical protein